MHKKSEEKTAASASGIRADASDGGEMAVAKVPQGHTININVRFVPVRGVELAPTGCRPREGAPHRDAEPSALPPNLTKKLLKTDESVVKWLAQDEANARLFMVRPAKALLKAGVELTRADQKAIARTHGEASQARVIGPGMKVESFTATASPHGKIGKSKPGAKSKDDLKQQLEKED